MAFSQIPQTQRVISQVPNYISSCHLLPFHSIPLSLSLLSIKLNRNPKSKTMSVITEEIRAKADELYTGNSMCQQKSKELLRDMNLPNGLLPLQDMEECGYIHDTGFVWLKQKKETEHEFQKIGRLVSYGTEVSANIEPGRIKNLKGVKAQEFLVWLTLNEIYLDDPPTGNIHFKVPVGLARTFPVSAFVVEEEEVKVVEGGGSGGAAAAAVEVKDV